MKTVGTVLWSFMFFACFALASNQPAQAQSFTVGQLHKHCRAFLKLPKKTGKGGYSKRQVIDILRCNSFIAGFHLGKIATNTMNNSIGPYCLPRGDKTTTDWVIKTFVNWARRHPQHKKRVAGFGIMMSLQKHYSCDDRDRK